MDNLNFVNIKGDNSQYVTNANSVYSVQIDYLESKNIKLLTDSNISFNFNINNEILIKESIQTPLPDQIWLFYKCLPNFVSRYKLYILIFK